MDTARSGCGSGRMWQCVTLAECGSADKSQTSLPCPQHCRGGSQGWRSKPLCPSLVPAVAGLCLMSLCPLCLLAGSSMRARRARAIGATSTKRTSGARRRRRRARMVPRRARSRTPRSEAAPSRSSLLWSQRGFGDVWLGGDFFLLFFFTFFQGKRLTG